MMPAANFRETSPYAVPINKVTSFFVTPCSFRHAARVTQIVESPCPYWLTLSDLCILIVSFFYSVCKGQILRWRKRHSTRSSRAIAPCPPMRPCKPRRAAKPAFQPSLPAFAPCPFACRSDSTIKRRISDCIPRGQISQWPVLAPPEGRQGLRRVPPYHLGTMGRNCQDRAIGGFRIVCKQISCCPLSRCLSDCGASDLPHCAVVAVGFLRLLRHEHLQSLQQFRRGGD